jgi:hypothetical protein
MPVPVRLLVFGAVGVALVAVPLYLLKQEGRAKRSQADAAERAVDSKARAAPAPTGPADPDRLGLTYGWHAPAEDGRLIASCAGQPPTALAGPHPGECDLRAGDTSCRTALPLLCVREAEARAVDVGTTEAVPGFALASIAAADARCAAEFGAAWRVARHGDANGLAVIGRLDEGRSAATHQRAWVAIDGGARAHCWDPPAER